MKRILTGAAAMRREDRLQQREDRLSDKVLDLRAEIASLTAEIERLRAALTFYADKNRYKTTSRYMCGHRGETEVQIEGGAKARAALQPKEGT